MRKNIYTTWRVLLFLIPAFMAGCSDLSDMEADNAGTERMPPLLRDAKRSLGTVSLLDIHRHDGKSRPTRTTEQNGEAPEIRWNEYTETRQDGQEIAFVPLAHKEKTASAQLTENGRSKKNICKVSSRLIVRRDRTTGKAVTVVGTYLHQRDFDMQRLDTVATDFTGTGFTGYFITSRTDGTMLAGKRIVNGKEQFRFYLNPLPPEQRPEEDGEEVEETHLFLDITPAAIGTRALSVRGKESGETLFCSICHRPGEDCYCIVIKPNCKICGQKQDVCLCDKCEECGELRVGGNCLCCAFCHKYPCTCHGSSNNNPKPGDTDTGNTGEGGNSGGYGGGSSSSVGTGGSSGGGGGSSTGSAKSSPATLTTTANKTVSTMKSKYGSSQAVCNFGVQTAFKSIYGSSNLPPGMKGRANEMAKAWADNPKYWQPISLSEAQSYANQGYFVVAGYINPVPERSGHVVVVVPGQGEKI